MRRLFTGKKKELDTESLELLNEFKSYLEIKGIKALTNLEIYDLIAEGLEDTNNRERDLNLKLINSEEQYPWNDKDKNGNLELRVLNLLRNLDIESPRGLEKNFDNIVCSQTLLMSYGWESMASPYHGGYYLTIESIARVVAIGESYKRIRFTSKEFSESLGKDRNKWGKGLLLFLGAFTVQKALGIPSIDSRDNTNITFKDTDLSPTGISDWVAPEVIENIISSEFKEEGSRVVLIDLQQDEDKLVDLNEMMKKYDSILDLNKKGYILSASNIKRGGIIRSIIEMSFGNKIGFKCKDLDYDELFKSKYGSIVLELKEDTPIFGLGEFTLLGRTTKEEEIAIDSTLMELDTLIKESKSC